MRDSSGEAIVVGAGPNGLAAAVVLAQSGRKVVVREATATVGGGCRSGELTLPGFTHDVCSAIHPLAKASPIFRSLPLESQGVEWIDPPIALAHPFDDGTAAILVRSIDETAATLGGDATSYRQLMTPLLDDYEKLLTALLGPLQLPRHPLALARFGLLALQPATTLVRSRFEDTHACGFFAGLAAHSFLRLDRPPSAAFGLVLALFGHAVGWPLPRGGSRAITDALVSTLRSLGSEVLVDSPVQSLDDVDPDQLVLLDLTARQIDDVAGDRLSPLFRRQLRRYRYGPGVFKIDWALDGPVPWRAPECRRAGTVHLGGTIEEIARSELDVTAGRHPDRPFVLIAQQSLFDSTRAPDGKQTLWGYCHVPPGSTVDMTPRIEAQIERFAPGFKERILARSVMGPAQFEQYNANYIGGDINGGVQNLRQLFTRPTVRIDPYATSDRSIFICSSSTPPGGGVHGMCGYHAARSAIMKHSR